MKSKMLNLIMFALLTASFAAGDMRALAQKGNNNTRTDSKMIYHFGPIMADSSNVYVIFYGDHRDRWQSRSIRNPRWLLHCYA